MTKINKNNMKNTNDKRIAKLEQYINTHKGDVKYMQGVVSYTPTTGGNNTYFSGLAVGDNAESRTGLRINLHSFHVNINYQMTASSNVRIIIVRDLMNQGVVPGLLEVLENASVISPHNYYNTIAQKRFIIHKDFTRHFTVGGKLFDTSLNKFKLDVPITYGGTGALIADARKNALFVYCVTDTASAGTVAIFTRLDFTDE